MPYAQETKSASITSTGAVTISSTLFGFTQLSGADRAVITNLGGSALNVTWSSISPTTAIGHRIASGANYDVSGTFNVNNIKLICASTTGGTAQACITIEC